MDIEDGDGRLLGVSNPGGGVQHRRSRDRLGVKGGNGDVIGQQPMNL
jgi:hypothetical protein